ncbi:3-isopropylmalate dehydratase small subunit [Thalassoroseus pseudoceratinae]|uniref:3-isopropylmalate dehydratase small subunit n=1 Tax=Thalassoroseus pseudoceratinae TaxID=2713176 RepID=UPI001422FFD5|nr:3-isopropylmalate dehydratase small subunit [Thalassoroseus pseudoceratinae]
MAKIEQVRGQGIPLLIDDIDTDRIIPARYLRCVTFDGLGEHAFKDDREQDKEHPFDHPHFQESTILISGRNFGCGSSREHAPQALMRWGVEAVIAESYAEIFFGNCTSLGIPAVCLERADLETLTSMVQQTPTLPITIDLVAKRVSCGDAEFPLTMAESARSALTSGEYDFLSQLLEGKAEIEKTAGQLPYLNHFQTA